MLPASDTAIKNWDPTGNSHWNVVDETDGTGTTDFISTWNTSGVQDRYNTRLNGTDPVGNANYRKIVIWWNYGCQDHGSASITVTVRDIGGTAKWTHTFAVGPAVGWQSSTYSAANTWTDVAGWTISVTGKVPAGTSTSLKLDEVRIIFYHEP